ncbi:LysE family transporter, partial [Candidatus Bathyarchaeota archaeon]|nr:LysE family transporter [Candidatus Bathyarchaeota archaeon]
LGEWFLLAGASFITGFSGALVPGPMFVATVMESTRIGGKAGPLLVLGHAMAELLMIVALVIGLSLVIELPATRLIVGILGGAFLLISALDLFRMARKAPLKSDSGRDAFVLLKYGPIIAGLLTSLSNPYFFVWWATVGNGFTLEAIRVGGILGITVFALAHWLSDLSWYTTVSFSIHKGRRVLSNRIYKAILFACGLLLIFFGADFIIGGLSSLQQ